MPKIRRPRDAYDHQSPVPIASMRSSRKAKSVGLRRSPTRATEAALRAGKPLNRGPEVGTVPGVCIGGCAMEVHQSAG